MRWIDSPLKRRVLQTTPELAKEQHVLLSNAPGVLLDLGVADVHTPSTLRPMGGGDSHVAPGPTPPSDTGTGGGNAGPGGASSAPPGSEPSPGPGDDKDKAGKKKTAKAAQRRGMKTVKIRGQLGPGGSLHVRHISMDAKDTQRVIQMRDGSMSLRDVRPIKRGDEVDPAAVGVTLKGPATYADGTEKKLVWIQLAECGAWNGHPSGPFQMTPATFSEIAKNFDARGLPVPFDYEHFSEVPNPPPGAVESGTPAPAWVHRLDNRGIGGLWGLTEWLEKARAQIHAGEYAYLSPAIRFGSKDPKTNAQVGAKLTSVALTNQPFLTGLEGLRAAKDGVYATIIDGVPVVAMAGRAPGFHEVALSQPHEYMPALRAALRMPDIATHGEMKDHVDRLRECCMNADGNGMHEGVDLRATYLNSLATVSGAGAASTPTDILDAVERMIDAAMARHEATMHPGMRDAPDPDDTEPNPIPAPDHEDTTMDATLLKSHIDAATAPLNTKVTELENTKGQLTTQLKDATAAKDTAVGIVDGALKVLKDAGIEPKANETLAGVVARVAEDNKALLADKVKREEADINADVERAFVTYKDVKKLSDKDKPSMLDHRKAHVASFNATYPPVGADQMHLLRSITPTESREENGQPPPQALSFTGLTAKLMSEEKLSVSDAQEKAAKIIAGKIPYPAPKK